MKDVPEPRSSAEALGRNGIEQVVQGDNRNADADLNPEWKMNQRRKRDHAETNGPEDDQQHGVCVEAELKEHDRAHQGDLEQYEPCATSDQEARQLPLRMMAAMHPEKCAEAGGEYERGRAEMCDPPSKENRDGGAGKIGWQELHGAAGNVITDVIDRHQHHDRTADRIH